MYKQLKKIAHILEWCWCSRQYDLLVSVPASHGQKIELRSQMFVQTDGTGTSSTIFVALWLNAAQSSTQGFDDIFSVDIGQVHKVLCRFGAKKNLYK